MWWAFLYRNWTNTIHYIPRDLVPSQKRVHELVTSHSVLQHLVFLNKISSPFNSDLWTDIKNTYFANYLLQIVTLQRNLLVWCLNHFWPFQMEADVLKDGFTFLNLTFLVTNIFLCNQALHQLRILVHYPQPKNEFSVQVNDQSEPGDIQSFQYNLKK